MHHSASVNRQPLGKAGIAAAIVLAAGVVGHWEGYSLTGYADPINIPTACRGHTAGVEIGKRYTPEQCEQWTNEDLREAALIVDRCIHVPMTDGQFGALTSATYNAGPAIVCGSTLQRMANAGDWAGACQQLGRWVYAHGIKFKGLVNRRAEETKLCMATN